MTDREIELESQLRNALAELHALRNAPTDRPPACDESTGDHTSDKIEAEREQRLSMLELGASTRNRELGEVRRQLEDIKHALDKVALAVAALPCNECPVHPKPTLRPIVGGGE